MVVNASPWEPGAKSDAALRPLGLKGARRELRKAWAVHQVRRGFWGTLAIALGSLSPAYLPQSSPWWAPLRALHLTGTPMRILGTILTLVGVGLLVDAWFRLRPLASHPEGEVVWRDLRHWAVLGIWGAPFLLAPPIFSLDAYSYAAQGWLVHNHINPYHVGPGVLPGGFADQVAWVWRFTPAPYGPLSLQIANGLDALAHFQPYASATLQRLPALAGVVMIGLLIPRIAVRIGVDPAPVAWFATLNPILVIDFIGGAHNDALMMGLVVLGVWIATYGEWWWLLGAIIVGVGASIKQPAFLAAYAIPLLARPWYSWRWREVGITVVRVLTSFVLAVGAFVLVSWLTGLGFGWYNAVDVPGMVVTISPSTTIGYALQFLVNFTHLDPTGHLIIRSTRTVFMVGGGILITWLGVTVARRRPAVFLAYGYLAAAILSPALHTWYVLWGVILLPLARPSEKIVRTAVWTTVGLLSYASIELAWRNGLAALGIAALGAYWWVVRIHHQSPPDSGPAAAVGSD